MDKLSSQPDEILTQILNLLPIKTAITTTVLSHRWRHLWYNLTTLDLTSFPQHLIENHTLEKILSKLISTSPLTLNLSWTFLKSKYPLHQICSKHIVNVIHVSPPPNNNIIRRSMITHYIFRISTLETLDLRVSVDFGGFDVFKVLLSNLRRLRLCVFAVDCVSVGQLIKCCPSLNDLTLVLNNSYDDLIPFVVDVFCDSLLRFDLRACFPDKSTRIEINAPNLRRFVLYSMYLSGFRCRFVERPVGLVEAVVATGGCKSKGQTRKMLELFERICNVESLELSWCFLFGGDDEYGLIVFPNLRYLSLSVKHSDEFRLVLGLLRLCPVLEVLRLRLSDGFGRDMGMSWIDYPCATPGCLVSCVKRVEIVIPSIKQVKDAENVAIYMLTHGLVLERLVLKVRGVVLHKCQMEVKHCMESLCEKLRHFPRNCPSQCEVEFSC